VVALHLLGIDSAFLIVFLFVHFIRSSMCASSSSTLLHQKGCIGPHCLPAPKSMGPCFHQHGIWKLGLHVFWTLLNISLGPSWSMRPPLLFYMPAGMPLPPSPTVHVEVTCSKKNPSSLGTWLWVLTMVVFSCTGEVLFSTTLHLLGWLYLLFSKFDIDIHWNFLPLLWQYIL
jgi:hypothetical protein